MVKARSFFYVCAGLFLLALSYHLGARSAAAQAPGNPVVALGIGVSGFQIVAATSNGDCYGYDGSAWIPLPNVFGTPTLVQQSTWGAVKSRYR